MRRALAFSIVSALALGCSSSSSNDAGAPADVAVGDVPRDDGFPSNCGATLGSCNWVTNEGCDGGLGCYRALVDGGVRQLCAAVGNGGWGAACASANNCRPGFACLGDPGRCTMLCCGADHARCGDDAQGGRAGALCVGAVLGSDARYCIETGACDPIATADNGCPNDRPRCDVVASNGATACSPLRGMGGGEGAPCCRGESCLAGYACIRPRGAGVCSDAAPDGLCRRFCNPSSDAGAQCPSGQACSLRFDGLPATIGACAPSA